MRKVTSAEWGLLAKTVQTLSLEAEGLAGEALIGINAGPICDYSRIHITEDGFDALMKDVPAHEQSDLKSEFTECKETGRRFAHRQLVAFGVAWVSCRLIEAETDGA